MFSAAWNNLKGSENSGGSQKGREQAHP